MLSLSLNKKVKAIEIINSKNKISFKQTFSYYLEAKSELVNCLFCGKQLENMHKCPYLYCPFEEPVKYKDKHEEEEIEEKETKEELQDEKQSKKKEKYDDKKKEKNDDKKKEKNVDKKKEKNDDKKKDKYDDNKKRKSNRRKRDSESD